MRSRMDWCSCAFRFSQVFLGLLIALPVGAPASAQDDSQEATLADYIDDPSYPEAGQYLQVSYRPRCRTCPPNCCTCAPHYEPGYVTEPGYAPETVPDATSESPSDAVPPTEPDIVSEFTPTAPSQFGTVSTGSYVAMAQNATGGYLDSAIVWSQLRVRYDAGYGVDEPDRAEYFYSKCQCFSGRGLPETNVDYQDISLYMENAFSDRFSLFAYLPVRFLNPEQNQNTDGLGDVQAGMKYAFIASNTQYFTFQLRTYVPTGDSDRQLGTGHVSIEPGLLYFQRLNRVRLEGEVKHWASIGGTDFAGNLLQYGAGLGYDVYRNSRANTRFTPIMEWVGWTVLDGGKLDTSAPGFIGDADGDTIVNFKIGARYVSGYDSVYAGWGHAVTGDVWYQDIMRFEYRRVF